MNELKQPLSRRAFLHGVGVTMALPWLESIPVFGSMPAAAANAADSTGGKHSRSRPVRCALQLLEGAAWVAPGVGARPKGV